MKKPATLGVLSAAIACLALGLFAGCDENKGRLIPNNPPSVRLTATPPDSGTAGYDVEFYWEGRDTDGEVDHFIYAIDPPDMYGSEDSVWIRTDANSGAFVFEATDYDTLYHWRNPQIAKSWHVFVIKAVDDMGAISEPDYLAFDATTIAPRTQFRTPPPGAGIQEYMGVPQGVGRRVTFRWEGNDADVLFNEGPVRYLFKVTEVTGKYQSQLATAVWEDTTEWIEHGPDDRKVVLDLDHGHNYAIAVRAIDEAGAVEPLLLVNGNMLWVGAREGISFPELTLRSTALGQRTWRGWGLDTETYEVPLGSRYEFTIDGNADWYGGLITGYSYGWDLVDLESNETDPEGRGAWTPWSTFRSSITGEFTEARDYFLHVRCKDDGRAITLATIRFRVIQLDPTKNLCYIDDWRKVHTNPAHGEQLDDQVWQRMLEGYNYGEDWEDISWDEWRVTYVEHMPSLKFLSKFRVVVWSLNDYNARALNEHRQSAWFYMNRLNTLNVLAVYMSSQGTSGEKGKVWAFGRGMVESAMTAHIPWGCAYPFPVDEDMSMDPPCGIGRRSFPMEYMHITGEFDESDTTSGGARINIFESWPDRPTHVFVDTAGPGIPKHLYTRPPAAELYPNLPRILPREPFRGSRDWPHYFEVLEHPRPNQEQQLLFYDPVSEQMTGLIPLYRIHARNPKSEAHNKYCGFRYIPSKPTDPAEIVYFFFPMATFKDPGIRATAKVVLSDWFGLPDPDLPGAGAYGAGHGEAGVQP